MKKKLAFSQKHLYPLTVLLFLSGAAFGQADSSSSSGASSGPPELFMQSLEIEDGMSYEEAVEIMGSEGVRLSHHWGSKDRPELKVYFEDGKVDRMTYHADYTRYLLEYTRALGGMYEETESGMKHDAFVQLLEEREGHVPDAVRAKKEESAFSYVWVTPKGKKVTIKFLDDAIKIKSHMWGTGVDRSKGSQKRGDEADDKEGTELSYEAYEKLDTGMTYDEVVEILGHEALKGSFRWGKAERPYVKVRFQDGKVVDKDLRPRYTEYEVEYTKALEGLRYDDEIDEGISHEELLSELEEREGKVPEQIEQGPPEFSFSYSWVTPDDNEIGLKFFSGRLRRKSFKNLSFYKQNEAEEGASDDGNVVADEEVLTQADYDRVKKGMAYDEAVERLGREGELLTDSAAAKDDKVEGIKEMLESFVEAEDPTAYKWENPDGSFLLLLTKDGIVKGRAHSGLKEP